MKEMKSKKKLKETKLIRAILIFGSQLRKDNVNAYASSCAFFIFLSLIPMVVLLCTLMKFIPVKDIDLYVLTSGLPETIGLILRNIVNEASRHSIGTVSISIIAMLWASGKGVNSLITGLNAIEHVEDKRNGIWTRILASLYTLVFLGGILIFLVLMVYGNVLEDAIVGHFPKLAKVFSTLVLFKGIISIVVMTLILMFLYAILPYGKRRIRIQFLGAFFTAVSWTLFSYFFSLYAKKTTAFSVYGSLSTIIILLFWLYFCMYLVFVGANINKYFRPIAVLIDDKYLRKKPYRGQPESLDD